MGAPFSKPQKPLPLQKLPRDVRLMIYEEVFDREAFICYVRLQWRERCRTTCDATNSWLHMASCTGIFTTWSYALKSPNREKTQIRWWKRRYQAETKSPLSLLFTCRVVYWEALSVLYSLTDFRCFGPDAAFLFLDQIPQHSLRAIRRFQVLFDGVKCCIQNLWKPQRCVTQYYAPGDGDVMQQRETAWPRLCRKLLELGRLDQLTVLLFSNGYPHHLNRGDHRKWQDEQLRHLMPLAANVGKANFQVKVLCRSWQLSPDFGQTLQDEDYQHLPFQLEWPRRPWVYVWTPTPMPIFGCYYRFLEHQWTPRS